MKQKAFLLPILLPISLIVTPQLIAAELGKGNKEHNKLTVGYSYFNFGVENINYQETPNNISVKSESSVSNFIIRTGGLYPISPDFNFSIDATASFAPEQSTEQWHHTGSGELLQKNLVTLTNASTVVLLHYKVSSSWQLLAGGSFSEETFKRFHFETISPDLVQDFSGSLIEESFSHFYLNLGIGYGSDMLKGQADHFSVRAYIGLPLWSETRNTTYPETTWTENNSYTINLQAQYSIAINENFQIGLYTSYGFIDRGGEGVFGAYNAITKLEDSYVSIPDAQTKRFMLGLEVLWQF